MTQSTEAMRLTDDETYVTHLLSCALTGVAPLPLPGGASWEGAFRLAAANSVTSTCAFAVSRVPGVTPGEVSRWKAQVDANLMRLALFDVEREAIFQKMDEAALARLPLKGLVTCRAYPRPEMRWMCDNDILCGRVLGGNASGMSGELWQMLAYMLESGTYGTLQNQVTNRLRQEAELDLGRGPRMRYILHRVFPPLKKLQLGYPVLKRHPWLLPAVYAYRIVVRPFVNGRRLRAELRVLKDADR